jgi:hypothetical protein
MKRWKRSSRAMAVSGTNVQKMRRARRSADTSRSSRCLPAATADEVSADGSSLTCGSSYVDGLGPDPSFPSSNEQDTGSRRATTRAGNGASSARPARGLWSLWSRFESLLGSHLASETSQTPQHVGGRLTIGFVRQHGPRFSEPNKRRWSRFIAAAKAVG